MQYSYTPIRPTELHFLNTQTSVSFENSFKNTGLHTAVSYKLLNLHKCIYCYVMMPLKLARRHKSPGKCYHYQKIETTSHTYVISWMHGVQGIQIFQFEEDIQMEQWLFVCKNITLTRCSSETHTYTEMQVLK